MPRRLALALTLATALAVSACASADAVSEPHAGESRTAGSSSTAQERSSTAADQQSAGQQALEQQALEQAGSSDAPPGDAQADASGEQSGGDPGEAGLPAGSGASVDDVLRLGGVVTWLEAPSRIALSLPASSGCWPTVGALVAESPTALALRVEQPQACGAPDAARTYALEVPAGVDAGARLRLTVTGLPAPLALALPAP